MIIKPRTEAEAAKAALRALLKAGWYNGRIVEAVEKVSRSGNDMTELKVVVFAANGDERTLTDWLTASDLGALKLLHCCEACGASGKYAAGEVGQDDFPGHDVQVKIGIAKRRGFRDQNAVEDYRAADSSSIVALRPAG